MRIAAFFSIGRNRSYSSPSIVRISAALASPGPIDAAMSPPVTPLGNVSALPSGRVIVMVSRRLARTRVMLLQKVPGTIFQGGAGVKFLPHRQTANGGRAGRGGDDAVRQLAGGREVSENALGRIKYEGSGAIPGPSKPAGARSYLPPCQDVVDRLVVGKDAPFLHLAVPDQSFPGSRCTPRYAVDGPARFPRPPAPRRRRSQCHRPVSSSPGRSRNSCAIQPSWLYALNALPGGVDKDVIGGHQCRQGLDVVMVDGGRERHESFS